MLPASKKLPELGSEQIEREHAIPDLHHIILGEGSKTAEGQRKDEQDDASNQQAGNDPQGQIGAGRQAYRCRFRRKDKPGEPHRSSIDSFRSRAWH
jgi:hypothetical protein